MTDPLELILPDTTDLDDGDVCVDIQTETVHILRGGHWCLASLDDRQAGQASLARWKAGGW